MYNASVIEYKKVVMLIILFLRFSSDYPKSLKINSPGFAPQKASSFKNFVSLEQLGQKYLPGSLSVNEYPHSLQTTALIIFYS